MPLRSPGSTEDTATPPRIQRDGAWALHIAHITASLSRNGGGVSPVVRELATYQAECGLLISLMGLKDVHTACDLGSCDTIHPYAGTVLGPSSYGYSLDLRRHLFGLSEVDLAHCHGLWMYPNCLASTYAAKRGIPLIISPHGMLDPWALKNSAWKKRLAGWFFEKRNLRSAVCIHALCESEYESIRACGLKNPVCIIPNGVDLPQDQPKLAPPWADVVDPGRKIMLFLGRIHPKKGLPNLIEAWLKLRRCAAGPISKWALVIAGWSQNGHEEELKKMVAEKGLGRDVIFLGPVFDDAKKACLQNADAFILPSLSEGLPVSVLEAWSNSLPVIMTAECNIPEGFQVGATVQVQPEVESIERGLRSFLSSSAGQQSEIGSKGRKLVVERFGWPHIAQQMLHVYRWVLGHTPKPDCVRLE